MNQKKKILSYIIFLCLSFILYCKPQIKKEVLKSVHIICDLEEKEYLKKEKELGTKVERKDKHTLIINWEKGQKEFKDVPPFDADLDGKEWSYCSYNKETGFHLINLRDGDYFTGVLFNEKNGRTLTAGQRVIMSPDRKKYLAESQPNGLDGEEWKIFDISGIMLWEGITPVSETSNGYYLGQLSHPDWNTEGNLKANHTCTFDESNANKKITVVTLNLSEPQPTWKPEVNCPKPQ